MNAVNARTRILGVLTATPLLLAAFQLWRLRAPESLDAQLQEHAPIEAATALLALGTAVVAGGRAFRAYRARSQRRAAIGFAALAAFGVWIAGEEVTWGQDLIGFGYVEVADLPVDSTHDLADVSLQVMARGLGSTDPVFLVSTGLVVLAIVAAAGMAVAARFPRVLDIARDLGRSEPARVVALAVLLGVAAVIVDNRAVRVVRDDLTERSVEEPLELMSAVTLLLAATTRRRDDPLP